MAGSAAARDSGYYVNSQSSYDSYISTGGAVPAVRPGASRNAYAPYTPGSVAEPLPVRQPVSRPRREQQKRQPAGKREPRVEVQKDIQVRHGRYTIAYLIVLAVGIGAFMNLQAYAQSVEKRVTINALTADRQELQLQNSNLQAKIYDSYDLEQVAQVAETELGMGLPEEHQIVYIDISKESYFIPYDDDIATMEESGVGVLSGVWGTIMGIIGQGE